MKSKQFNQFNEDAVDRGWTIVGESSKEVGGYVFWTSIYHNGGLKLVVTHNPDGIATITDENGTSIPQADHNASPTNEDWLDVLTVD